MGGILFFTSELYRIYPVLVRESVDILSGSSRASYPITVRALVASCGRRGYLAPLNELSSSMQLMNVLISSLANDTMVDSSKWGMVDTTTDILEIENYQEHIQEIASTIQSNAQLKRFDFDAEIPCDTSNLSRD